MAIFAAPLLTLSPHRELLKKMYGTVSHKTFAHVSFLHTRKSRFLWVWVLNLEVSEATWSAHVEILDLICRAY